MGKKDFVKVHAASTVWTRPQVEYPHERCADVAFQQIVATSPMCVGTFLYVVYVVSKE